MHKITNVSKVVKFFITHYIEKFTPKYEQYNKNHTNVFNEYLFKNIFDVFSFIIWKIMRNFISLILIKNWKKNHNPKNG
jgi:hypothetical protein